MPWYSYLSHECDGPLPAAPTSPPRCRAHDEEAVCCVCADGLSLEPNIIVFCERCDIAVHQACYGVRNIPAGERN